MSVATREEDDRELTAYLDGELDAGERQTLEARLAMDASLRERLEALRDAGDSLRGAFDTLLDAAPLAAMRARLQTRVAASGAPRWRFRAAAIAAGVALVAFLVGFGAGHWGPGEELADRDDWRQSVTEYMALYTQETFGQTPSPQLGEELASLSQRLDTPLDSDRLKVDDLSPRRAELLQYDGAPLGQIGYVDGATPIAFCILRDGEVDSAFAASSHDGFAVASWAQGGRGFMLIGKIPLERLTALARALKDKTG
ncbi:MAG: anti-sigma factor [Bradyrhizobium sp.]|nr:MAG: anti-sigma factor [Bradyrhizobium sp.]